MLRHIVFWKIKDNEDKEKNMERMVKMLYALDGKVKGLESIELGYNFDSSSDYDVVLYAVFKSPAALKFYQNHPQHIKCKEFISTIAEKRASADYVPEASELINFDEFEEDSKPVGFEAEEGAKSHAIHKPAPIQPSAVKTESKPSESKKPKDDVSVPDIQTTSAASYESLVRPIIPGINAPIDYVPPEKNEEDYGGYIPEVVQRSIRETQEDYDILESIVESDENEPYSPTVSEEVLQDNKPNEPVKEAEPIMPAEPAKAANPVKSAEPIETVKPMKSTESAMPFVTSKSDESSASMPFTHQESASAKPETTTSQFTTSEAKPEPFKVESINPETAQTEKPLSEIPKPVSPTPKPSFTVAPTVTSVEQPKPTKPAEPEIPAIPAAKPQKKSRFFGAKKPEPELPKKDDMSNKWRCSVCGRVNANYVGTCGCGASKPLDDFDRPAEQPVKNEPQIENAWKCPKCGLLHSNFITDCSCGYVHGSELSGESMTADKTSRRDFKNDNDLPPAAPMRASDFSSDPKVELGTNMPKSAPMEVSTVDMDKIKGLKFRERSKNVVAPPTPTPEIQPTTPVRPTPPPPPIVKSKPEKKSFFGRRKKTEEVREAVDMTKFWVCPNCGKLNHNYVGTCGCGESKPFVFNNNDNSSDETFIPKSNAWKCPECGRLNNNFITKCSCGHEGGTESVE